MRINPSSIVIPAGFSCRKANNNDVDIIKSLIHNTLKEYGLVPEPQGVDKDLDDIESNYAHGYFGVIENQTDIVATFALTPLSRDEVEIRKMYALPSARGLGLGKWMIQYLLQICQENNYKIAELETASVLKEAIALYQKIGFSEKDFENKTPRCDKSFHIKLI